MFPFTLKPRGSYANIPSPIRFYFLKFGYMHFVIKIYEPPCIFSVMRKEKLSSVPPLQDGGVRITLTWKPQASMLPVRLSGR